MMRICLRPFVVFAVLASLASDCPAADGKGPPNRKNNNNQRRESPQEKARKLAQKQREEAERLRKAAAELAREEQAAFAAVNQEIAEAKNAHRASSKTLTEAKEKATQAVEKSLGIPETTAKRREASRREALEDRVRRVIHDMEPGNDRAVSVAA